jgi:hypothetical protein
LTSTMKNLRPRNIVYIGEEDGETSTTTKRRPKNSSNMKRKNQVQFNIINYLILSFSKALLFL